MHHCAAKRDLVHLKCVSLIKILITYNSNWIL